MVEAAATGGVEPEAGTWICIDLWKRRLYVMDGQQPVDQFKIAAGKKRFPTPIGVWQVKNKSRNWGSGFGTRWLGLNVPWGK